MSNMTANMAAKLLADGIMFLCNYQIQQQMVFNEKRVGRSSHAKP